MTSPSPFIHTQCGEICHGSIICKCCVAVDEKSRQYAQERGIQYNVLFEEKVVIFIIPSDVELEGFDEIQEELADFGVEIHKF